MEETEHFPLSDRMEIHFVDLSKITGKKPVNEMGELERLAAYIKFAGDKSKESYLESLLAAGGETLAMVERLFKELTEDKLAYEKRERQLKGTLDRNTALYAAGLEGEKRGEARGKIEGEKKLNTLYSFLIKDGRFDDMKKAVEDEVFREQLYKEFNI